MPHHHADMVMRHNPVRRDVVPSHRLPFLVSTPSQNLDMPSLVARAPVSSETGEKPTSSMTTTVLPVVLGAGYVGSIQPCTVPTNKFG